MMTTNRISLLGNAVRQATIKTFDNGNRVAQLTIATNERGFTTKSGIVVPDRTDFHNLIIKGGLVSVVEKYIDKGTKLCVIGSLRYRTYEKDDEKRTITEIHVREIELLGRTAKSQSEDISEQIVEQKTVYLATENDDDLPF